MNTLNQKGSRNLSIKLWPLFSDQLAKASVAYCTPRVFRTLRNSSLEFERKNFSIPIRSQRRKFSITLLFEESERKPDALTPYIRTSIKSNHLQEKRNEDTPIPHSEFTVCFLGTGGGKATTQRLSSSTLLRLGGSSFLFDAGEALQRQMQFCRANVADIHKIFITHLHADHVLGLPGILLAIRGASKIFEGKQTTVELYGPPGLYNFVAATMLLTYSTTEDFSVIVHELVGSSQEMFGLRRHTNRGNELFYKDLPEFSAARLVKKTIPRNQDGTWTIEDPGSKTREGAAWTKTKKGSKSYESFGNEKKFHITAGEVRHRGCVPTFGFVVREEDPPGTIDPAKAKKLGVRPGPKYRLLKNGFPVMSDDGTRDVKPKEVLTKISKPRKFVLLGDNSSVPKNLKDVCTDADVLVQEATVMDENASEVKERGHSTAGMAGNLAREVGAKVLILNHFGGAAHRPINDAAESLVESAVSTNHNVSKIAASFDFMELYVPFGGFTFSEDRVSSDR